MSLIKGPTMTEKKLFANRNNAGISHGPTTVRGKARISAGRRRHGHYAESQDAVLRCLGEDPVEFQELVDGLREEFAPTGALQERLLNRLARVLWLMDRSERSQEGEALRRARAADGGRQNHVHARLMRLSMTVGSLRSLARLVARERYVTTPREMDLIKNLRQDPELGEMGEILMALFCQLQDPGAFDEAGNPLGTQEAQRKVLIRVKEIFGLNEAPATGGLKEGREDDGAKATGKPSPYPHITAADWEAREPVRQLLENILTHQAEFCEETRQAVLKEAVAGLSPFERATEVAPLHQDALAMRKIQDLNFREVRRVTNLLLKMKRQERRKEPGEAGDEIAARDSNPNGDPSGCHDVIQNTGT